jgi:hypothetical protein
MFSILSILSNDTEKVSHSFDIRNMMPQRIFSCIMYMDIWIHWYISIYHIYHLSIYVSHLPIHLLENRPLQVQSMGPYGAPPCSLKPLESRFLDLHFVVVYFEVISIMYGSSRGVRWFIHVHTTRYWLFIDGYKKD